MKTLLLLRHAKSSKQDTTLRDFDRPLEERGEKDARLMGDYIRKEKIQADLVISSPAKRARQTAELAMMSAGLKVELRFDKHIYEANARRLLDVIAHIEDTANTVMLIGHNPGFKELFAVLTGESSDLPTASLARIELGVEKWTEVREGVAHRKWLMTPKELRHD